MTVGFGVLGFQRAQLARRTFEREARAGLEWAVPAARRLVQESGRVVGPAIAHITER